MKSELFQDALLLLQKEISPETGIILDLKEEDVLPLIDLLQQYPLSPHRQHRLLSIYIAIKFALLRHECCTESASGEQLTRSVLDGDYLYSLYMQLGLKWEEYDLLTHLASLIKRIQINQVEGTPVEDLLLTGWGVYLQLEDRRKRSSKAI